MHLSIRPILVGAVVISLVIAVPALGQQTNSAPLPQDPQAVSALTAALAAMQGSSLLTSGKSQVAVLITGTYTSFTGTNTSPQPLRIKILGLDQIRWEMDEPEGTYVTVIEPNGSWRFGPTGSRMLPIRDAVGRQLEIFPILAVADWMATPTEYSCQMAGTDSISGRPAQHLTISHLPTWTNDANEQAEIESLTKIDFYLDAQNNTPLRLHYNEHPRDWRVNVPVDLDFSNYQQVGGVSMPMTIDRFVIGVKVGEFQFTSVTFNASISPSDF